MTLEIFVQKYSFLTRAIGDLNVKFKIWYSQDKTSFEGKTIESITLEFGVISVN